MDESFLLHLQNHLDPTSSLFSDASSASSSSSLLGSSSSTAPLLFFTITSAFSYVASVRCSSSSSPSSPSPTSDHSLSSFQALSLEMIWSMDSPVRDAQWHSSYGLSYLVVKLKPDIALYNHREGIRQ